MTNLPHALRPLTAMFAIILGALILAPRSSPADPPSLSGSGNFTTGGDEATARAQFAGLRSMGAQAIRLDVYPYLYDDGKQPLPWSDHPGTSFTVQEIPATATRLDLYGWDGLRRSVPLSGQTSYPVTGLGENEISMFVAVSPGNSVPGPRR